MAQQTVWDYLIAFITLAALAIGLISVAVGKIADWRDRHAPRRRARARPQRRRRVMSRPTMQRRSQRVPVAPVVTVPTAALLPIVTPNNAYGSGLSDSGRVQFETTAKTVAALYEAGLVTNLSKAICRAYGCSVQAAAKTDSTYQMALKAVNRHLKKDEPEYRELTPEQEAVRAQLRMKQKGALN